MADSETISILLTVTGAQGAPRVPLSISKTVSAAALRQQASEATKIPLASLKLIFRGRLIADDDTKVAASEYKLEEGSVVHCMGKPAASSAAPVASTATTRTLPAVTAATPTLPTTTPPTPAVAPPPPQDPLQAALQQLRSSCSTPSDYLTAVTTLDKILSNIVQNPMEQKYRQVKVQNAAFQRRLGGRMGGDAAMKAAGFATTQAEDDASQQVYLLEASANAWPQLLATKAAVEAAVRDAKSAANQPAMPGAMNSSSGGDGMGGMGGMGAGGMGGMGAGGMGSPEMQRAAAQLASNPAQLQAMLQNPMFQSMLRNHPQFANNPMGQQMLEEMTNNPAMLSQVAQMMQDPNAMSRMQSMMPPQPGAAPSFFPPTQQQQPQVPQQQRSGPSGGDEQMTEEEMIAEAIRRSLQDES